MQKFKKLNADKFQADRHPNSTRIVKVKHRLLPKKNFKTLVLKQDGMACY